jgi:hypothetical protein
VGVVAAVAVLYLLVGKQLLGELELLGKAIMEALEAVEM